MEIELDVTYKGKLLELRQDDNQRNEEDGLPVLVTSRDLCILDVS